MDAFHAIEIKIEEPDCDDTKDVEMYLEFLEGDFRNDIPPEFENCMKEDMEHINIMSNDQLQLPITTSNDVATNNLTILSTGVNNLYTVDRGFQNRNSSIVNSNSKEAKHTKYNYVKKILKQKAFNPKFYKCPMCSFQATTLENLKEHESEHYLPRSLFCLYCKTFYPTPKILKQHINKKHPNLNPYPYVKPNKERKYEQNRNIPKYTPRENRKNEVLSKDSNGYACLKTKNNCIYNISILQKQAQKIIQNNRIGERIMDPNLTSSQIQIPCYKSVVKAKLDKKMCDKITEKSAVKAKLDKVCEKVTVKPNFKPYLCSVCTVCGRFVHASMLEVHMKTHESNEANIKCTLCYKMLNVKDLENHRKTHENTPNNKYSICSSKFKVNDLETYMKAHQNEPDIKCNLCSKQLKISELESHTKQHQNGPDIKCTICHLKCKIIDLESHMKTHQNGPVIKCNLCYKQISKGELVSHAKIHQFKPDIKCTICYQKCKVDDFESHMKAHQNGPVIKCKLCFRQLQVNELESHLKAHASYKCPFCSETFYTPNSLKLHLLEAEGKSDCAVKFMDKIKKFSGIVDEVTLRKGDVLQLVEIVNSHNL